MVEVRRRQHDDVHVPPHQHLLVALQRLFDAMALSDGGGALGREVADGDDAGAGMGLEGATCVAPRRAPTTATRNCSGKGLSLRSDSQSRSARDGTAQRRSAGRREKMALAAS